MERTDRIDSLVSVIMPAYNAEKFIVSSLKSVLSQSHENLELIVIDDNSRDNTKDLILEEASKDDRIVFIGLNENMGAAYTRNVGLDKSQGSYITFCDSDDLWYPDKLSVQLQFMTSKGLSFTCSGYDVIDSLDVRQGYYIPPTRASYFRLKYANFIGCLTVIYDKKVHGHLRMPDIRSRQDYALWLEIFRQIKTSENIRQRLASYRVTSSSLSSNYFYSAVNHYNVLRYIHGLNRFESFVAFCTYTINAVIKKLRYKFA